MVVSRIGTFWLDGEEVQGIFVSATIAELKKIPFNPLLSRVELHPMETGLEKDNDNNATR